MNPSDWTWLHVLGIVLLYWVAIIGTWSFRVSRPEARERARAQHFQGSSIDPATGQMTMTFTNAVNLNRIAAILLVPPLLFVLVFLVVGAR